MKNWLCGTKTREEADEVFNRAIDNGAKLLDHPRNMYHGKSYLWGCIDGHSRIFVTYMPPTWTSFETLTIEQVREQFKTREEQAK